MENKDNELEKLEKLAESFTTMGNFTQVMRDSYARLESEYEDVNSRLARINELLRTSLVERNRLAHYLSNILESLDSGVIVADLEGIINIFNSAAERYTGIAADSALGRKYSEVLDTNLFPEILQSVFRDGKSYSGEITLEPRGGLAIPVAYSAARLRQISADDQGGMVIILYDLTENKKLEENLKRVSTLAALGEMAATVAHEIRNPLSGISGFTSLLLRDLDKGSDSRRLVEKISQGVKSLNAIVASLLNYTRSVTPEISEVDAVRVVEEAISDIKTGSEMGSNSIQLISSSKNFKAMLDPHLFRLVVFNLIKNAVQAIPDGGHIRLILKNTSTGELLLQVEDDGPGIPEGVFDKLFVPFFTTKTNGTGLGLATVKKLTELHGGRVMARNRPEGGALFEVQIPNKAAGESNEV
jgi:PAS domain S-box-containing protein